MGIQAALYERQRLTDVVAAPVQATAAKGNAQASRKCETAAQSNGQCILSKAVLQCIAVGSLHNSMSRILPRCICIDRRLLPTSVTQQHRAMSNACCQEQMLLRIAVASLHKRYEQHTCFVLTQGCCQPMLRSSTEQ